MSNLGKRMFLRALAVTAAGAATVALAGAPADAWTYSVSVSGTLNTNGTLVQYSTYRSHSSGPAGLTLTDQVAGACQPARFGLRNTGGTQVTGTLVYYGTGVYGSWGTVNAGNYAVNGRIGTPCGGGSDNGWSGTLYL